MNMVAQLEPDPRRSVVECEGGNRSRRLVGCMVKLWDDDLKSSDDPLATTDVRLVALTTTCSPRHIAIDAR